MRRLICGAMCAAALLGCGTVPGGGDGVKQVHLFGLPVTLNLDGKPGMDGFAVRIFATKAGAAKGAVISGGAIEILMFDGVASHEVIARSDPTQRWKFDAKELAPFREKSALGDGYVLTLRWNQMPAKGHITVVARHVPAKGEPIYSAPSTITSVMK